MNDKLPLLDGFVYAYLTQYPNTTTWCYTSSKYNGVEQSALGLTTSFTVYSKKSKKNLNTTGVDDLIYSCWLNDASSEDIDVLQTECPTVILLIEDMNDEVAGTIFTDRKSYEEFTAPPVSAEVAVATK